MVDVEFAIKYLKAVEKKNEAYFNEHHLQIMECVKISGDRSVTVSVDKKDLPPQIKNEIETMF